MNTTLSQGQEQAKNNPATFEVLTADELAKRLNVPASWIRDQVRSRAVDPIPHLRLGRYCRFQWLSPELAAWLARRKSRAAHSAIC
jgi:hypothetical protein